ncbi:MAG: ACT domain-containing protein [Clostridia bacterium]|nr:ACT domain-containing protein [Clostridia bacterium]
MKAIITTTGKDRTGILAELTRYISDMNCNVEDISQTIMQGNFVMIMMIDLSSACGSFADIKSGLDKISEKSGLAIHIQRAEIFEQMHHV